LENSLLFDSAEPSQRTADSTKCSVGQRRNTGKVVGRRNYAVPTAKRSHCRCSNVGYDWEN